MQVGEQPIRPLKCIDQFAVAHSPSTHLHFQIPVNDNNEMLQSPIQPNDPQGELIQMASLSICDEAPMANKAVIACVDERCWRVMCADELFGGKVMILAGDFQQTCPMIRNGLKAQVIDASIRSWPFWEDLKIYHLTCPCCNARNPKFQQWVDSIGDGAGPDIDLSMLKQVTHMQDILDFIFPIHVLADPLQCL